MASDSVSKGPETPETPITISVDGDLGAVEFVRRLHRAGLELVNADDGSYAVLRLAASQEPEERRTQSIRLALFQASGIVHAVRISLDCKDHIQIDEAQLASALEAAGEMIDNAAGQLEGVDHE